MLQTFQTMNSSKSYFEISRLQRHLVLSSVDKLSVHYKMFLLFTVNYKMFLLFTVNYKMFLLFTVRFAFNHYNNLKGLRLHNTVNSG